MQRNQRSLKLQTETHFCFNNECNKKSSNHNESRNYIFKANFPGDAKHSRLISTFNP